MRELKVDVSDKMSGDESQGSDTGFCVNDVDDFSERGNEAPVVCITDYVPQYIDSSREELEYYQQPTFTVRRDIIVHGITMTQITANNLEMDSDIVKESSSEDDKEILCQNRYRYIDNSNFSNARQINCYLRHWGKIPQFLEVRLTPDKGYGVFALSDIAPDTPLGFYQGIPRLSQIGLSPKAGYLFNIYNFNGEMEGIIDSQNLTYANFTRFINHDETPNCTAVIHPLSVVISSNDLIPAGTELTINYGKKYWKELTEAYKEDHASPCNSLK